MRRQAKPYQQFKKDLGRFYGSNSRLFTASQSRYMQRVFKHFPVEHHEAISKYPNWFSDIYARNRFDIRNAMRDVETRDEEIRLITSFAWVQNYLNILEAGAS